MNPQKGAPPRQVAAVSAPAPVGTKLTVTKIPQYSEAGGPTETDRIEGVVSGVRGEDVRIVVFAKTNTWYVQPLANAFMTAVGSGGKWSCETHLGVQYAVLLVRPEYSSRVRPVIDDLPLKGGDILDVLVVEARKGPYDR